MEPNRASELLLTTLAERDSRIRTARLKLGRLIALFTGIAAVLLLASHHPAKASGPSSLLPDGAGLSVSFPLGAFPGAAARPSVRVFAIIGDEQVGSERNRPASPQRIAFAPIATVGGLAGVAAWPSNRLSTVNRSRNGAAMPSVRGTETEFGQSRADAVQAGSIRARRMARLAAASYQRMLRRYLSLPQGTSEATANAHARLVRAYEIARAWRNYAGIN